MQLRVRVDKKAATDPNLVAAAQRLGVAPADVFDLTRPRRDTGAIETLPQPDDEGERAPRRSRARQRVRCWRAWRARHAAQRMRRRRSTAGRSPTRTSGPTTPSRRPAKSDAARRRRRQRSASERPTTRAAPRARPGSTPSRRPTCSTCCASPPTPAAATCPTTCTSEALTYCAKRRAMLIVDPRPAWDDRGGRAVRRWPA